MYTYESFETLGAFTLLRPVFITLFIVSLGLFLMVIIPLFKKKFVNGFSVVSLSVLSVVVAGQLLFYDAIIVDEIGLSGDPVSFYMFLAIVGVGVLNPVIYFYKKGKKS